MQNPTALSQSHSLFFEFTTKMMKLLPKCISRKDKLGYINGDIPQPPSTDPTFRKWRIDNAIVKSWLINSMDPSLIGNFIRFPTTRCGIPLLPLTLMLKQWRLLEKYYNDLQGLWHEIDFRPNPMECAVDIHNYNLLLQEDRVYVFLDGLDDRLDKIRGDVLQLRPFPTVEQAYAHVRREALRQSVMITGSAMRFVLFSQSKDSNLVPPSNLFMHNGGPKSHWWNDLQAKKGRDTGTKDEGFATAIVATAEPQLSFIPQMTMLNSGNCGYACYTSTNDGYRGAWLLDSGATDHMTFTAMDFTTTSLPRHTNIANANGVTSHILGGTCDLIP
ncbi:hypothetical protein AAG906_038982 [Vitis piasezkii]